MDVEKTVNRQIDEYIDLKYPIITALLLIALI